MTDKVITIEGIIQSNREQIVDGLMGAYERWKPQRQVKEAEWQEVRDYIFATDTTTTSNSSLPWRNKTTIPKLAQIRDNLHANYMDALFPNDNWLDWDGDSEQDVEKQKRKIIVQYVKNKAMQAGLRETISQALYDYIDYGNCFAEVIYVDEHYTDPATGEEVSVYKGAKALRISPYDITFNPTASHFNKTPKFTRYLKTVAEIKKELLTRPDLKYDEEVFQKAVNMRRSISSYGKEDLQKVTSYLADGFGSWSEYLSTGLVELIEFEGDWYDEAADELHENVIVTVMDRTWVLRNIPNPSWLGRDNKVHVGWRERPDNLYAMGPLDNLVGMQYRLDHLENLKADALDQTINPPIAIIGDVEPFEWAPGATLHLPEDGDVKLLSPNPAVFQVNNELGYFLQLMEEMAGAPKEAMGMRTPGEKTMFEVQQLQNAASRIFNNKINKFSIQFLEPILNLFLEVSKRNIDVADTIKVLDDDLGVTDFIKITKDDITAKGKLRPVGARHYAAKAQLMQNLATIFNSPMGQIIGPDLSRKKLTELIQEVLGLEKYGLFQPNVAVAEQAETQGLVNEHANRINAEQTVPMEEQMLQQPSQ